MPAQTNLIPPDGGYGWIICFAYALNHFILVPVMTSFGLIFRDTFVQMGFSATDGSVIINTNAACGMMTGLINGPLMKYFGPRKVSIASAFFTTLGVILTSYANSFTQFLVTYSLVTSLGMGMGMSSYPYALNLYFVRRRSKAAGIAMTIAGLGPILIPQLISLLMYIYGVQGAMLVIGGVAANSFIAALLIQPVEWHMVRAAVDVEQTAKATLIPDAADDDPDAEMCDKTNLASQSLLSIDHDLDVQAIYGVETPLAGSVLSLNQVGIRSRKQSFASIIEDDSSGRYNRDGKVPIIQEELLVQTKDANSNAMPKASGTSKLKRKHCWQSISKALVTIFDLALFADPIYINIMVGMSLAVFAEINFSLLTPFILDDFQLSTSQIATFLSVLSTADLCFRFLSPFIGDFLNKPARLMYMFSLTLLISSRFTLLLFEQYEHLLGVALLLGVAKGIRTVYWTLVLPSYVPIERLANASGIQMLVNGLLILAGGPLIGVIRDVTGSYRRCIVVINIVTFTTLCLWTIELLYLRAKRARCPTQAPLSPATTVK